MTQIHWTKSIKKWLTGFSLFFYNSLQYIWCCIKVLKFDVWIIQKKCSQCCSPPITPYLPSPCTNGNVWSESHLFHHLSVMVSFLLLSFSDIVIYIFFCHSCFDDVTTLQFAIFLKSFVQLYYFIVCLFWKRLLS